MMKQFFIGVDSDGTAFDSMTIKHRQAFIPTMIRMWHYADYEEQIFEICEKINLFSKTRGIDRFTGLLVAFSQIGERGIPVPNYGDLKNFLKMGKLSNAVLKQYIQEYPSIFLEQVLTWSMEADNIFQEKMEKMSPFPGVKDCLEAALPYADIAVISSASLSSLQKDWSKDGLDTVISTLYGQEHGGKEAQLATAAKGYDQGKKLMIGDALSDYEAAKSVGAWFYPILPGKEVLSWKQLRDTYLNMYFQGKFNARIQSDLLTQFMAEMGV